MVADADSNVEFFTARLRSARQYSQMMIGCNADQGAIVPDRHQSRDRKIGAAITVILGDNGACRDVGTALVFEEPRDWKLIGERRLGNDIFLARRRGHDPVR